jgi:hypothetical protein
MRSATRPEPWLWLCLLMMLAGNSAAQAPQSQSPSDRPGVKLPAILSAKPVAEDPKDDELRKLLKARYNEAVGELKDYYEANDLANRAGITRRDGPDDLYGRWQRLVQAGLELCDKPAEKVALLTQYLEVTKEAEKIEQARYDAGRIRIGDLHRARYERLDAQVQLLRAKREAEGTKGK